MPPKRIIYRKIDANFLPEDYRTDEKEGLYVEFYPDGQVKHVGFYIGGNCRDNWALYLEQGKPRGRAIRENGSGGAPDKEVYKDGVVELFSAFEDEPHERDWATWARKWIYDIGKKAEGLTGAASDASLTTEEVEKLGKGVSGLVPGMGLDQAGRALLLYDLKDRLVGESSGPVQRTRTIYHFGPGRDLILHENLSDRVLTDFELAGAGWPEKVRKAVQKNRRRPGGTV